MPASDPRFDDAVRLQQAGNIDGAIYLLQQIHQDYPRDTRVLMKLGELAIGAKNWAYAIEVLRKAADLRPDDITARLVLMDVYHAYQMPIQEIKAGREIIALDARHPVALRRLASLYEEQAMFEDEETTRRLLADVEPRNYNNLKRLASMLEYTGELWEATLYFERIVREFPDKTSDAANLARLYGLEGDRYAEFRQWDRVRDMPGGGAPPVTTAYRHAYYTHKRDLRLFDPFAAQVLVQQGVGTIDRNPYVDVSLGYQRLFITQNADLGLVAHYRHQEWIPLTAAISGNRQIDSHGALLDYTQRWGGDQTMLRLRGGYEGIAVGGNTLAVDTVFATPATVPFVEQRKYGGLIGVGDLDLDHRFNRNFGLRVLGFHQPIQDLDAYARALSTTGGRFGLYYAWPDGTFLEGNYQREHYSDGNDRGYAMAHFSYPLFMSDAIRDRGGARTGYLFPVPEHQLRLDYMYENIGFNYVSPLYESFKSDNRHTVWLSGQHQLGGKFYFAEEGLVEFGSVLQRQYGVRAGFVYEDPDNLDRISLMYGTLSEQVKEGTQANANLQGGSRLQGVQLNVLWHFGTAPKKDPTLPRRHK